MCGQTGGRWLQREVCREVGTLTASTDRSGRARLLPRTPTGHQEQPGFRISFDHVGRGATGVTRTFDALNGPKRRHTDLDGPTRGAGREFFEAKADRCGPDCPRHRIDRGLLATMTRAGLLGRGSAYVEGVLSLPDRHSALARHRLVQGVALDRARHAPGATAAAT